MVALLWIPAEAWLLSSIGTTPGKTLLSISMRGPSDEKLSFEDAFQRAKKVWWRGMGANILILNLVMMARSHAELTRERITSWDREHGVSVTFDTVSAPRMIVLVVIWVVLLFSWLFDFLS